MSRHVSVVRDAAGLSEAISILATVLETIPGESTRMEDWILANMALSGLAIASAALNREESRGAHYRSDFPETNPALDGIHYALQTRTDGDDHWFAGSLNAARFPVAT
jgi:L-aspartate oxidase